ncbi:MAG: hypothetical protein LH473_06610 [Chitinophagales bacterium]|nr:hypothetical protein [Chitinophagales bacterium]
MNSAFIISFTVTTPQTKNIEYSILKGSKVSVVGSTNINEFSCFSEETYSKKTAALINNDDQQTIYFKNAILNVSVKSLDCSNVVMNANLCRTLNAEKFPYITIELNNVKATDGKELKLSEWQHLQADVIITLAGTERRNKIFFSGKETQSGKYQFVGDHTLSLNDYHIESPTALFGIIKVKDNIKVKVDLLISGNEMIEQ